MTSIERTAYPRFGREVSARELDGLSPLPDEIEWARDRTRSDEHLLALVVSLKCFQRLGYFPRGEQVPDVVVAHVRDCLTLDRRTISDAAERTVEWQRELVRERVGAVFDPERTRIVAEGAIRAAAEVKNHPPDLINVALELLVKESLELPGFSTLDRMAAAIRAEVNTALFEGVTGRMAPLEARRLHGLLEVAGPSRKSPYDGLKQRLAARRGRGSASRLGTWRGLTRWGAPTCGSMGSRSRRSRISRARRGPLTRR